MPKSRTKKPSYWEEACAELMKQDRILRKLIPKYDDGILGSRGDAFTTLARSIVGQQISVAAAQSVWNRTLETLGNEVTPKRVLDTKHDALRASGLSTRKVEYIRDLADHFHHGRLQTERWPKMDDEELIKELSAIRGIGRWTAEMFLMFGLMRPDVLPIDDLGLLRGISLNYFSGEPVTRSEAGEVGEAWAPYRSVATWYLWRSLDPVPVEY